MDMNNHMIKKYGRREEMSSSGLVPEAEIEAIQSSTHSAKLSVALKFTGYGRNVPSLMRERQGRPPQGLLTPCLRFLWEGQLHALLSSLVMACLTARNRNPLQQAKQWNNIQQRELINYGCTQLHGKFHKHNVKQKIPETEWFMLWDCIYITMPN